MSVLFHCLPEGPPRGLSRGRSNLNGRDPCAASCQVTSVTLCLVVMTTEFHHVTRDTSSVRRHPQREELTEGVPLVLPYDLGDVVGEVFRDAS